MPTPNSPSFRFREQTIVLAVLAQCHPITFVVTENLMKSVLAEVVTLTEPESHAPADSNRSVSEGEAISKDVTLGPGPSNNGSSHANRSTPGGNG